ncbi:MAG: DUF6252 family protein [Bacteroidota bacterium]
MKLQYPVFALLISSLLACQPVDPGEITPEPDEEGGLLEALVNGVEFKVGGLLVSAEINDLANGIQTLTVGGANLPVNGEHDGIVLAVVSTDSTDIEAGEVYKASLQDPRVGGEYVIERDNQDDLKAFSSETGVATITITALDRDKKLVSGTFSFDAVDPDFPDTVYEVREGKFTAVPYN